MNKIFSTSMQDDLNRSVRLALSTQGIINIPQLAEDIRKRNEDENVALEDIAAQLMIQAQIYSAAMEFDRTDLVEPT